GMQYRVTLETEHGTTATEESNDPASYRAELVVKVKVPKPHKSLAEITKLNSELPAVLPELPTLLESAKISPSFDDLYRLKCAALQSSLNRLDNLLTRHNFYDLETVLELEHPKTKRRAIFIQSEMDVDTDGSDIERVPVIEGASSTFQPFTSYRWPRKTDVISPFSAPREEKLKLVEQELAGNPPQARKESLKSTQTDLKNEIGDLKKFSFLVGQTDPFIVLPGSMFSKSKAGPFAPAVGDYCVVIIGRVLYPAIVGDVGPANLMGEASLRICKQILPKANAAFRPVEELKATYLVFPGTADRPFAAPDLAKWRTRCAKFLDELGGQRGDLFVWEDLTKPPPPPPAPTTAAPSASPTPIKATPVPAATPAEKKG
ncbi:MAG: glycoside hydrolase family 75 protein, partial [Chthoniobacteraceae bacterium]